MTSPIPERMPTRAIVLLAVAAVASHAMVRVSDPLVPQIAADIGTTVGAASIVASAYAVSHGLTQAVAGPLGDRWPKYPTVAVLCTLSGLATLACGLAQSLTALGFARLLCGITAGMIIPLGMAFIGDVVPYERRQPVLGRFLTGQISGLIFGQAAGGVLGDYFGWRTVFFLLAAMFLIATAGLVLELAANPLTRMSPRVASKSGLIAGYRHVLSRPWARAVTLSAFIEGALMFGSFAYVGADLHVRQGLSFTAVGLVLGLFGAGGLVYAAGVQQLVNRLGQTGLAAGGGIILGICYLVLAAGLHWSVGFVAIGIIGLSFFMLHNTLQVNATQMAPEARSTALGIFSAALYLGQSFGIALAAPVIDRFGAPPLFIISAVLLPVLGLWFAAGLRRH
jgi:MFS transporter, YNFM family, putative membrane transport protein